MQDVSATPSNVPENPASFALSFLWLEKNVAVAVDQMFTEVSITTLPVQLCRSTIATFETCMPPLDWTDVVKPTDAPKNVG